MATHVNFAVGIKEISGAIAAGSLPELVIGGAILVGGFWIVKKLIETYVKTNDESVIVEEREDGIHIAPA